MRTAAIDGVIGDVVRVQRAAVDFHMMIEQQSDQIGVTVAAIHRSAFAQRDILKLDMRRAALYGDIADQRAGTVAIDHQGARAGNAQNQRSVRLIDTA